MKEKIETIAKAQSLLYFFGINFQTLYGEHSLSFNLHTLVFHWTEDVVRHGSSSLHTMFNLESTLGYVTKKIKGNQGVSNQIITSNSYKLTFS